MRISSEAIPVVRASAAILIPAGPAPTMIISYMSSKSPRRHDSTDNGVISSCQCAWLALDTTVAGYYFTTIIYFLFAVRTVDSSFWVTWSIQLIQGHLHGPD